MFNAGGGSMGRDTREYALDDESQQMPVKAGAPVGVAATPEAGGYDGSGIMAGRLGVGGGYAGGLPGARIDGGSMPMPMMGGGMPGVPMSPLLQMMRGADPRALKLHALRSQMGLR